MLNLEQDVFLQPASKSRRLLHPGKVVRIRHQSLTVILEENLASSDITGDDGLCLKRDQKIFIYFNRQRNFLKQAARIVDVSETATESEQDESNNCVRLETEGEPVPAENRESYRVSTVHAELTATFGEIAECALVDISAKGFAVISPQKYTVGQLVTAAPHYEDFQSVGKVCIQSAQALKDGRFRYGVVCVEKNFQAKVQKLCMLLQRQQLRRLACRT